MAGFLAKGLEITDRRAVGGEDAQAGARFHGPQLAVGAQHGEGTGEAFDVQQGFAHGQYGGDAPA